MSTSSVRRQHVPLLLQNEERLSRTMLITGVSREGSVIHLRDANREVDSRRGILFEVSKVNFQLLSVGFFVFQIARVFVNGLVH